jgi:hypothetical protein
MAAESIHSTASEGEFHAGAAGTPDGGGIHSDEDGGAPAVANPNGCEYKNSEDIDIDGPGADANELMSNGI